MSSHPLVSSTRKLPFPDFPLCVHDMSEQAKCKALREEMDGLRWARQEEARAIRESAEAAKAALTRQLREREDELEAQRSDAAETFDRLMQQAQHEAKAR